jgi:uncharacterized membrane-anchored protein
MSETLSKESKGQLGRVRVDDRPKHLATRLERGEIAVINVADLDRESAAALVEAAPIAVLNAQPSLTGRTAALGPRLILDAGIALVDDLGQDIMSLREGQEVAVTGGKVLVDGGVIATGRTVSAEDLDVEVADSATLFAGFEGSVEDYLAKDGATVLRGEGVPSIDGLGKRPILLVSAASEAASDCRALARWRSEAAPFVIAVDGGADVALKAHLTLDLVVGDADLMSEKAIRRARAFIVRVGGDGLAPGAQRLDRMGIVYERVAMAGTSLDAALVVAAHSSATAVITAGVSYGEAELVDAGRALVAPAFFSRLAVGSLLIGAQAVAATFRPRPRGWTLVLLALVALGLMGVALWSTPWGNDLLHPITSFFVSLMHSAGGTQ